MQASQKQKNTGAIVSLSIGSITGLTAVISGLLLPAGLSGEGLFTLGYFITTGFATIALYISFLISLWFAGKIIATEIIKGTKLTKISLKYTLIVNFIIWPVFIITAFTSNFVINSGAWNNIIENYLFIIILPIVLFVFSILGTPYTIGLLICYVIKKRLFNKYNNLSFS